MAGTQADEDAALLLRDFVNTRDVETATDEISTPAGLAAWLAGRGLVAAEHPEARPAATEADLATALALREGLRTAMSAHHGPVSPALPADLEDALATLPLRITFAGTGPALLPLAPEAPTAAAGLARVAAAIMDSAAAGTWPRLKVCQEDTCRWAFLDTSKNRSRAWCSMRVCGNRTKTRAYRARRRAPGDDHADTGHPDADHPAVDD